MFSLRNLRTGTTSLCGGSVLPDAPMAPEPVADPHTIVFVSAGSNLVFENGNSNKWSCAGTERLAEKIKHISGRVTVFVCINMKAADLAAMREYRAWSRCGLDVRTMSILEGVTLNGATAQHTFEINSNGRLDVYVVSTDYLDALSMHYGCKGMVADALHSNCCYLACERFLMEHYNLQHGDAERLFDDGHLPTSDLRVEHVTASGSLAQSIVGTDVPMSIGAAQK